MFNPIEYYDMLRLFAVTTQTQLSAPTVPPRSDTISRDAVSARNSLAPRPMTSNQFKPKLYKRDPLSTCRWEHWGHEHNNSCQIQYVKIRFANEILGHRTCVTQQEQQPLHENPGPLQLECERSYLTRRCQWTFFLTRHDPHVCKNQWLGEQSDSNKWYNTWDPQASPIQFNRSHQYSNQ